MCCSNYYNHYNNYYCYYNHYCYNNNSIDCH